MSGSETMTGPASPNADASFPAGKAVLGMLLGLAAALIATLQLPFDPYLAWQRARGTQMLHAQWIYERIRFDPTPIDIAVIGSSRVEAGISAPILSNQLSAALGRKVEVVNLSIVMPGRDFHYKIAQMLLDHRRETRLILLSDDGDVVNSHPMFRETATVAEVAGAPMLINSKYAANLLALPYRNLINFAEQLVPGWFGVNRRFDAGRYAGATLDRSLGYRLPDGTQVNGDIEQAAPELLRMSSAAVARQRAGLAPLKRLPRQQRLAVDHHYVEQVRALAHARNVRLAFLALPLFGPSQSPGERSFYKSIGPVIDLGPLAWDPGLYQSGAHLNRRGAERASIMAGAALVPIARDALETAR